MDDMTKGEVVEMVPAEFGRLEMALDDIGHASAVLQIALEAAENNAPIHEAEGKSAQAELDRAVAESIREAQAMLTAGALDAVTDPLARLRLAAELGKLVADYKALGDEPLKKLKIAARVREILADMGGVPSAAPEEVAEAEEGPEKGSGGRFYDFDPNRKHAQRKRDNAAAMKILADVDAGLIDPEVLTDDQKAALAKYSGTGGSLTGADGKKGSFFEYYTPKPIASGMWDLMRELGFQGGKVLDPSAGTGIFGATAPDDAIVDAVELNDTSGKINRLLNSGPGNNVEISNFEKVAANTPDDAYDAIITNVPFGDTKARGGNELDDPRYQREPLENYFVLRSLEKLRPGGLAAFITPPRVVSMKGGKQEDLRIRASYMAEFVGAYRLPNSVFGTADADTITDVIVFRKYARPVLEKIEELREQSPATLVEANVVWGEFVSGKYFEGEGRRFVLGEFQAKDPNKLRDVDRVISNGSVADIAKLLRKFPDSRVNWKLLESTETEPIFYKDGDTITQRGQTLQYRDGKWVALVSNEANTEMLELAPRLATAYDAFTNGVTYTLARKYLKYMQETAQDLDIPGWLRDADANLMRLGTESDRARYWGAGVVGLSVAQILDGHSGEAGFNYSEEYPELTTAMKRVASDAKSCPGAVGGQIKAGMKTLGAHYTARGGYSGVWKGVYQAEGADVRSEDQKFDAAKYTSKGIWVDRAEAAALYGEGFDPIADPAWCISDDGKSVSRADDYFIGNYAEMLAKLDKAAAAATDEAIKGKLLAMRHEADQRVERVDVTKVGFNLFSPYVGIEEKAEFLRRFLSPEFAIAYDEETGKRYIAWGGKDSDKSVRAKLMRRFAIYLKNGTVTLGGAAVGDERAALNQLRDMIQTANEQFDGWAKSNPLVIGGLQERANDPTRLRFRQVEDETPFAIPGLGGGLTPHGYQFSFIRSQGRSFGGINGFNVGLGKTLTALASVQHALNIGVKKKTAFVVPNSVLSNWRKESGRAYESTDDCLFVGLSVDKKGEAVVRSSDYDRDLNIIMENRHRKIFMTMEAFQRIRLKDDTVSDYEAYMRRVDVSFADSESAKESTVAAGNTKRLSAMLTEGKTGATPYLEDMGIDSLVIDEAHAFKNSASTVSFKSAKFLSLPESSVRGIDAQAKAWYIRGRSPLGDGVLLLTATPITNSPLEIYSMLSLAVGRDRVNDMAMGIRGADEFMEAVSIVNTEEDETIDGIVRETRVFHGLGNVQIIRKALGDVAVIKDAEMVGAQIVQPDAEEIATPVALPEPPVIEMLQKYRAAFRYAIDELKGKGDNRGDPVAYEEVAAKFGEPLDLIGHPFNLINKMTMLIMDSELDERATFYTVIESQKDKAEEVIQKFNAKKFTEERARPGPHTRPGDIVGRKVKKEDDDKIELLEIAVNARLVGNRILIDTTTPATQLKFEEMADKAGLDLDVSIPPKLAAMLENFIKEETNPRGVDAEGKPSPRVKQLIFCDILPMHAKIRRALMKRAGVPAGAIAFVTGTINGKPDEILAVQDGFNAGGDDNKYRVVIANEKAEVGINLQIGTQAIHHLTVGWTPDSKTQRDGRGVRQGNRTTRVNVYTYDADGTFDSAKRSMVNKKASWIDDVMDVNGGESVAISGGMSRERMEALIDTVGDEDAMTRINERTEAKEKEVRAAGTRARQIVNLKTIASARKFAEETPGIKFWAAKKAAEYYATKQQMAVLSARMSNPQATASAIINNEARHAELKARADGLYRQFDEAIKMTQGGVPIMLDEVITRATGYVKRGDDPKQYVINAIVGPVYTVTEVEESELANEWQSEMDMAKSLISTAKASFTKGSKENGGIPKEVMEIYAEKGGLLVNGTPVVEGAFVRANGELGVVIDRGSRVLFYAAGGESRVMSYADIKGGELIQPGSAEYEVATSEAAAYDDSLADSGVAISQNGYSQTFSALVPAVSQKRTNVTLMEYTQSAHMLPPPFYPFVLNPADAGKGAVLAKIINQQASVIKRFGHADGTVYGNGHDRFAVGADIAMIRLADVRTQIVGDDYALPVEAMALSAYAKAHGLRVSREEMIAANVTVGELAKIGQASAKAAGKKIDDVIYVGGDSEKLASDTAEGLDGLALAWVKTLLPEFDLSGYEVGDVLSYSDASELRLAVSNLKAKTSQGGAAPVDEESPKTGGQEAESALQEDSGMVGVQGNTRHWKEEIKSAATNSGGKAIWDGDAGQWNIPREAWDKLVQSFPAVEQVGQLVLVAASAKTSYGKRKR